MQPEPPARPDLVGEVRLRIPLPIVVPVVAIVLIAAAAFGFSRILLTVPPEAATVLALVMAANILIAASLIALRRRMHRVAVLEVVLIALYPVLVGVVLANTSIGEETEAGASEAAAEAGAPATEEGAAPSGDAITLVAESIQFDTDAITVPAREEVTVTLDNQDTAPHNFAVYRDESAGEAIFEGENVDAGASTDYEFTAPPPGEYYFQCDLHPTMNGTVTAE